MSVDPSERRRAIQAHLAAQRSQRRASRALAAIEYVRDVLGTLGVVAVLHVLGVLELGVGHLTGAVLAVAITRTVIRRRQERTP